MPVVLITPEKLLHRQEKFVDMFNDAGFEIRYPDDSTFTRGLVGAEETIRQLSGCHALLAGGEFMTADVLAALPELRVIARSGVGYDRIDIPAATARGVAVTITPTSNHEAVAELALSLVFAVAKHIPVNNRNVRSGAWATELTEPIRGKTFGIVGLGRIGRSTAVRAKALGMTVIAHESFPDEDFTREHNVEIVDRPSSGITSSVTRVPANSSPVS